MIHPEHDPNDRIWHIGRNGVYSAPRVHKNGHRRPKSVSFETKGAALRKHLKNIRKLIDECTARIKRARKPKLAEAYREARKEYRQKEKETIKALNELNLHTG